MEWISGNVFVRPMGGNEGIKPGFKMSGHTHNFDHTSLFFKGKWSVKRWREAVDASGEQLTSDGKPAWVLIDNFERDAPFHLLIEAGCRHEFVYLGDDVQPWMEAYLSKLTPADAASFRAEYQKNLSQAWCVYSHRTPQGDVSEHMTGWGGAYQ